MVEVSPLRRLPLAQAPPRSPGCNGSQAGSAASRPCNAAESACARGAVTWTAALLLDLRRAAPPAGKAERKEHVLDERDALARDAARVCLWSQDGDYESDTYGTSCGRYYCIIEGAPDENDMKYCCYCGGKLEQVLIEPDGGER